MGDPIILLFWILVTVAVEVSRARSDRRLSRLRSQRRQSHRAERTVMYVMGVEFGIVAHALQEGHPSMGMEVMQATIPNIERAARECGYVVTTMPLKNESRVFVRLVKRRDTACDA